MKLYSLAICPPLPVVQTISSSFKQELAEAIGWFPSKNSEAHMTLNIFLADKWQLKAWEKYLYYACYYLDPFEINLVKVGIYPSTGTLYLGQGDDSNAQLKKFIKEFNKEIPFTLEKISSDPHMSIARGLRKDQLDLVSRLWENKQIDIKFTCNNLAIREYDDHLKQYFVLERFNFNGDPQLLLF